MTNSELHYFAQAVQFSREAHGEQKRKYTNEPYWHHPWDVACILIGAGISDLEMIVAAILHDVVEDTDFTIKDIKDRFGNEVGILVDWLTDTSSPADGNRAARKAIDRERLAKAPNRVKTIKLADLIDNSKSIIEHDERFSRVYIAEKKQLLKALEGGAPALMAKAEFIVKEYEKAN